METRTRNMIISNMSKYEYNDEHMITKRNIISYKKSREVPLQIHNTDNSTSSDGTS